MKILLAIDGSEFSKAAVETLIREVRPENSEVHVLNVVESLTPTSPAYSFGRGAAFVEDFMAITQARHCQGEELVSQTARLLQSAGFATKTIVRDGDAKSTIMEYASAWHPELIVVGSHGRKGLNRFLLGSVSDAVARQADCSVQIVRLQPKETSSEASSEGTSHQQDTAILTKG